VVLRLTQLQLWRLILIQMFRDGYRKFFRRFDKQLVDTITLLRQCDI
jgi:hypothetical protein